MSISDTKTRVSLIVEKEDKVSLERIAKKQDRSVNWVINRAIKEYIAAQESNFH